MWISRNEGVHDLGSRPRPPRRLDKEFVGDREKLHMSILIETGGSYGPKRSMQMSGAEASFHLKQGNDCADDQIP